ncbi:hypothetical protein ACHAXA_001257 [Cyclostephanos tholiformis]|uniref:Helicase-associated domain-containing protein n=1 Tax=Cyclostephanos tholiformis TaxID=382380 RepID=A0ABD3RDI1_9STRA
MRSFSLLFASSMAMLLPSSVILVVGCRRALPLLLIPPHHRRLSGPRITPCLSSPSVVIERDDVASYVVDDGDDMVEDYVASSSRNVAVGGVPHRERRPPVAFAAAATADGHDIPGNGTSTTTTNRVDDGRRLLLLHDDDDDRKLLGRAFVAKLNELEAYRREYGDCLVPKRYRNNPSLGNWVNKQRQNYRKFMRGEKTSMNETRISALNERGFVWDATSLPLKSHRGDCNWQRMYDQLAQYRKANGHCRVPSSCPLGQWVVRQRFLYRRQPPSSFASGEEEEGGGGGKRSISSSSLTDDRIRLLNDLDFQWSSRSEGTWARRMRELREFKSRNGHVLVPSTYLPNPQLSAWVATQRKNYNRRKAGKTSPLTMGRIRELDELGFGNDDSGDVLFFLVLSSSPLDDTTADVRHWIMIMPSLLFAVATVLMAVGGGGDGGGTSSTFPLSRDDDDEGGAGTCRVYNNEVNNDEDEYKDEVNNDEDEDKDDKDKYEDESEDEDEDEDGGDDEEEDEG